MSFLQTQQRMYVTDFTDISAILLFCCVRSIDRNFGFGVFRFFKFCLEIVWLAYVEDAWEAEAFYLGES